MKRAWWMAAVLVAACGIVRAEDEKKPVPPATPGPTTPVAPADEKPVAVDVTKKDQIDGALDKQAVVTGTVESAKWTKSGKTLQVLFKDAGEDFRVVAFGKNKEELDKAFDGDIAKALDGKTIQVTGKVRKYNGSIEAWKKYTEVPVTKPEQIKVVDAAKEKKD